MGVETLALRPWRAKQANPQPWLSTPTLILPLPKGEDNKALLI